MFSYARYAGPSKRKNRVDFFEIRGPQITIQKKVCPFSFFLILSQKEVLDSCRWKKLEFRALDELRAMYQPLPDNPASQANVNSLGGVTKAFMECPVAKRRQICRTRMLVMSK